MLLTSLRLGEESGQKRKGRERRRSVLAAACLTTKLGWWKSMASSICRVWKTPSQAELSSEEQTAGNTCFTCPGFFPVRNFGSPPSHSLCCTMDEQISTRPPLREEVWNHLLAINALWWLSYLPPHHTLSSPVFQLISITASSSQLPWPLGN